MQPIERKRQGYIHELIQTEERYVDDLQLVVEVRAHRWLAREASGMEEEGGTWSRVSPLMYEFTSRDESSHTQDAVSAGWRGLKDLKSTLSPKLGDSEWRERKEDTQMPQSEVVELPSRKDQGAEKVGGH